MIYGPHRETKQGDKTRIKGEYYWVKKKIGYTLRKSSSEEANWQDQTFYGGYTILPKTKTKCY